MKNSFIQTFIYALFERYPNTPIFVWRAIESNYVFIGIDQKETSIKQEDFLDQDHVFFYHEFESNIYNAKTIDPKILIKIHLYEEEIEILSDEKPHSLIELFYRLKENLLHDFNSFKRIGLNQTMSHESALSRWENSFKRAMKYLNSSELEKIVISRKETYSSRTILNHQLLFWHPVYEALTNLDHYFVFYRNKQNHFFFTKSPETLVKINNNNFQIDALAGTRKKSDDPIENEKIKCELLNNHKEKKEQQLVKESIIETLNHLNIPITGITPSNIKELSFVQHIHSIIEGKITQDKFLDVIHQLHPTPAVGTRPKKGAKLIEIAEKQKRGLYAGVFGFKTQDTLNITVNIRNIDFNADQMNLYAGCGILPESNLIDEYTETKRKLQNFTNFINLKNRENSLQYKLSSPQEAVQE